MWAHALKPNAAVVVLSSLRNHAILQAFATVVHSMHREISARCAAGHRNVAMLHAVKRFVVTIKLAV